MILQFSDCHPYQQVFLYPSQMTTCVIDRSKTSANIQCIVILILKIEIYQMYQIKLLIAIFKVLLHKRSTFLDKCF